MSASSAALQRFLQLHPELETEVPTSADHYLQPLVHAEELVGENLFDASALQQLQALYREQEAWRAAEAADDRHHFIITIPVADRPQQLERCLESLLHLCKLFHYGRSSSGQYSKLTLLISDDSLSTENQAAIRSSTESFDRHGIPSIYFGMQEQQALLASFSAEQQASLADLITLPEPGTTHKGASTTRNIAYLKLHTLQQQWPTEEKLLFWFVDSDQEFRVNISDGREERDLYCINYLYLFDRIFQQHDPVMVTGKLVGDPPVSPTVMASNLLFDLNHFLSEASQQSGADSCQFHHHSDHSEGEAAYHDMTDLFGYPVPQKPYRYRCDLEQPHNHTTCLERFSKRLNQFFYGEHPTRRAYHRYQPLEQSIKPARTVYTANYLFTPQGLNAFIPFAPLKLRMAGPMLGRFLQQSLQKRFLSANLPMVHKRTQGEAGRAEHRPGVEHADHGPQHINFSVEFERQFYGDVALFTVEKLSEQGYPATPCSSATIHTILKQKEAEMRQRYQQQRSEIQSRLQQFESQWRSGWWCDMESAMAQQVAQFIDNIRNNFLEPSSAWTKINSASHRRQRLQQIATALEQHPQAEQAWSSLLQ